MEQLLISIPILILSVVLHEVAHGWAARAQGDNTAAMLGRLSLNPLVHLDPVGSVLLPGILAMTGAPILGWAKPVPVNPRNFREYKRGDIIVSLAGVFVNLLLAIAFTLLVVVAIWGQRLLPGVGAGWEIVAEMAGYGVAINFGLMIFNLIPIPPLDGSHVFYHFLPPRLGAQYRQLGQYGMLILFALLFFTSFSFLSAPLSLLNGAASAVVQALV